MGSPGARREIDKARDPRPAALAGIEPPRPKVSSFQPTAPEMGEEVFPHPLSALKEMSPGLARAHVRGSDASESSGASLGRPSHGSTAARSTPKSRARRCTLALAGNARRESNPEAAAPTVKQPTSESRTR